MVDGAALQAIIFDEAGNAPRLLYKNEDGENVPCAICDDLDSLVHMIQLHLAFKKSFSDALRDHDLANSMARNEVPEINRILATRLGYR